MKVVVTLPDGSTHELAVRPGASIMECMRSAGLPIRAECGGAMACATCHVRVDPAWIERVGGARGEEIDLLDMSDYRTANSRLCCQIRPGPALDGLRVELQLDAYEG
ncbi:MAG: 2Fe-2S iron-sulfur cluster binding domain-containing protein [Proteobacteria bacterium]|nr:2Fe-2S iron-sulfur cluster binding domain-containing protein [Pseudomonadota bacterium]